MNRQRYVLAAACADPTLLQLYFFIPLTLSAAQSKGSGQPLQRAIVHNSGKGDGKGLGRKDGAVRTQSLNRIRPVEKNTVQQQQESS